MGIFAAITDVGPIFTFVAAIIAGTGAVWVVVHEMRRRERRVSRKEIKDLSREVDDLLEEQHAMRVLLLEQRRYIYKLVTLMIDHGMDPPPPPAPSFDPGEYDTE